MTPYFLYAITCAKNNKIYVGMSNTVNPKYNPMYYFISKSEEGLYEVLNQSIKEHGRSSHVFTRLDKFVDLELEAAEQIKYKIVQFYQQRNRSLNDNNEEPIRYTCDCGYRILEHKKDLHNCKVELKDKLMAELDEISF